MTKNWLQCRGAMVLGMPSPSPAADSGLNLGEGGTIYLTNIRSLSFCVRVTGLKGEKRLRED